LGWWWTFRQSMVGNQDHTHKCITVGIAPPHPPRSTHTLYSQSAWSDIIAALPLRD